MKNKQVYFLLLFVFVLSFIGQTLAQTMPKDADPKLWQQALAIHKKAIIVDGHNDIPSPMYDEDFDLGTSSVGKFHKDGDPFHTDLSRFKQSGITGEFFSIYVSRTYAENGGSGAARRALDLIDATYREVEKYPNQLVMCRTANEIRKAKKQNKICALMGIEGGHAIEDSLFALRDFYRLGIRYMTLTHNNTNNWADAHRDEPRNNGLSDFGKEVVREMNRIGMLVDISHVSVKTMSDVLDVSTAPIIASHSNARGVADHTRNVPDDILKRIAKNGGVVMINFYPSFLDERTNNEENERSKRLKPQLDALKEKYKDNKEAYNQAERQLFAENPIYVPSYTRIVDHIDHIKKVAGIDYIGIGSDYDGVPFLPQGMDGMEDLVLVTYEMLRRGYSETDIRKVLGENFMRAFEQAEKVAKINSRKISGEGSLKKIK
ncbi:MAG: membrane dipeptidase [Acidobacteria bacterium]|jgi:membrane dipeptidase|nr:membrane dipeptidase [Acidobacteriota bacterium]